VDQPGSRWGDKRIEQMMGNLLRAGVVAAAVVVLAGGVLYLIHYGTARPDTRVFHGEDPEFRTVHGIVADALTFESRGIIQFGLLLLIATPVARVVFSAGAFALERDFLYVAITLLVLGVLAYSLLGEHK
jgi:uncharacterized membrane protein